MSYTEALTRVAQIETEVAALTGGGAAPSSRSQSFAQTLASAQARQTQTPVAPEQTLASTGAATDTALPVSSAPVEMALSGPASSLLFTASPQAAPLDALAWQAAGSPSTGLTAQTSVATGGFEAPAALPAAAQALLTPAQQQFAARLAADTGLDPGVVSAWLLAEESGGAASGREAEDNNDWLNIGYTDSGSYGVADSVWSNPISAAEATAGWLSGRETIPGYGTASGGIEGILASAGQAPQAQIAAIQGSGWASSGYPDLTALFQQVAG